MNFKKVFLSVCALSIGSMAHAITFSAAQGNLAAQVDFTVVGGNLQVVLTNTSTFDCTVPGDILSCVLFNITGTSTLTPISALITSGSNVYNSGVLQNIPSGDVGGAWAYKSGFSPISGATQGISSAGFGVFGTPDVFPGNNADGGPGVDGLDFGLLSAGDNLATENGGMSGRDLTQNSTTFLLSGIPQNFDLNKINTVAFQYGTALTETRLVTPEPCTMLALVGLLALRRRKKVSA